MSPEKNPLRKVTAARADIEHLLFRYRGEVGAGKMERAAKTLADVIWRLLDIVAPAEIVEPVAPAPAAPAAPAKPIETKFSIEVGGLSPNDAKKFVEEQLATVATVHANAVAAQAAAAAPTEPVDTHSGGNPAVLRNMPSEPPQALGARLDEPSEEVLTQLQLPLTVTPNGTGEPCAPCDVSIPNNPDLIEDFKETVIDREAGTVTRNGITEPIIEHQTQAAPVEPVAPAPKTTKKAKPST